MKTAEKERILDILQRADAHLLSVERRRKLAAKKYIESGKDKGSFEYIALRTEMDDKLIARGYIIAMQGICARFGIKYAS